MSRADSQRLAAFGATVPDARVKTSNTARKPG